MSVGIDECKRLIDFAADLVNGGVASFADGKLTWDDLFKFTPALSSGLAALQHIGDARAELSDLDEAEQAELFAYAQSKMPGAYAQVVGVIKSIIDLIRPLCHLYGCFQPDAMKDAAIA